MFLVSTTQRCGSTWLTRLLEAMTNSHCRYVDALALGFSLHGTNAPEAIAKLVETLQTMDQIQVFKTHDVPSGDFDAVCATMPELKVLTVRRDFRDVVVSRYFYYRYYWPTDPALGLLHEYLAQSFHAMDGVADQQALTHLIDSPVVRNWAAEWSAFEGAFSTGNALRLRYEGLLDGAERQNLERFTRYPYPSLASFSTSQAQETAKTGRQGSHRFFREGQCGQWRKWFTEEEGLALESLVSPTMPNTTPI